MVERNGRKEYYYYCRSAEGNKPVITVCLLVEGSEIARGISICSPNDVIEKKEGRKYARKYAMKALYSKQSTGVIKNPKVMDIIDNIVGPNYNILFRGIFYPDCNNIYKSDYIPELTPYEIKLIY